MHCDSGEGWVRAIIFGALEKLFQKDVDCNGGRGGGGEDVQDALPESAVRPWVGYDLRSPTFLQSPSQPASIHPSVIHPPLSPSLPSFHLSLVCVPIRPSNHLPPLCSLISFVTVETSDVAPGTPHRAGLTLTLSPCPQAHCPGGVHKGKHLGAGLAWAPSTADPEGSEHNVFCR